MTLTIASYLPSGRAGDSPNTVAITLPESGRTITGLLDSDVSVSFQNRFGSLIPDISGLADLAQVFNMTSMPAWIGASAQAWKGTDPIRVGVSFYLINYKPGLDYDLDIEALATYCTMSKAEGWNGDTSAWTVKVHGGYQPNFLDNNSTYFDEAGQFIASKQTDYLTAVGTRLQGGSNGTIKIRVGNKLKINNLLLLKLDVTSSIVEVRDKKPLYYRIDAQFQTCRAALADDLSGMFG